HTRSDRDWSSDVCSSDLTFRIASENAVFGQPEVKLGIIPGYGGTQRLARLVGSGQAAQILMTGEMVNAEEALRIGLVNQVVPREIGRASCRERGYIAGVA